MPKNYAVIGLGKFGSTVARELAKRGNQVFACDRDTDKVEEIGAEIAHAMELDATDEAALKDAGIDEVDSAIVSFGQSVADSLLVTMLLKEMGIAEVIVKVNDERDAKLLRRIGADRVIFPERDGAIRLVENLLEPHIFDVIELSEEYSMVEIAATKDMLGKKLVELHLRKRFGVNVIAIKSKVPTFSKKGLPDIAEKVNIAPGAEDEIREGDILVIIGRDEDIDRVKKL